MVLSDAIHTRGIVNEDEHDRTPGNDLHDGILVQLLSFFQLLALAGSSQQLLGFLELPLFNFPLQSVLLTLYPAPTDFHVTMMPFTVKCLVNISSDETSTLQAVDVTELLYSALLAAAMLPCTCQCNLTTNSCP